MKILLFGAEGQIGWELQRSLQPMGEVLALGREPHPSGWCGDLCDLDGIERTIAGYRPKLIVNAAAYTQVDAAEQHPELARRVNALAPERMAEGARALRALLLHFSTDYVLADEGDFARAENGSVGPLNAYGRSKLDGEIAVRSSGCRLLLVRTAWVHSARGHNFVKTVLRLAAKQDELHIVDDQIGSPTAASTVADVCAPLLYFTLRQRKLEGLYHLCDQGHTSWHGCAQFIVATALRHGAPLRVKGPEAVRAIRSADWNATAAQRPHNSRLSCQKLQSNFPLTLPPWQVGVERTVRELLAKPDTWA